MFQSRKFINASLSKCFCGGHRLTLFTLLSVFVIALALRLASIWAFSNPPEKDALQYHQLALNQLAGYGHALEPGRPTTLRPPLYPLFLAGIYALTGQDYRHALYVQAILHASLVFPLFWLGFRVSGCISVGILAAGLFAVHTSFEIVSGLYRENITIVLVVFFLWNLYEGCKQPQKGRFIVAGIISGLLGLTNPVFIPISLGLFFFSLLCANCRSLAKLLFVQSVVSIVIITPWLIRNQMILDRGQEALNHHVILYGYYPAFTDEWWWPVSDMTELEGKRERASYFLSQNDEGWDLWSKLRSKILAHPLGVAKLAISRILILWISPPVGTSLLRSYSSFLSSTGLVVQYFFVFLGLVTLGWKFFKQSEILTFAVFALYVTAVYALTHSIRRYGYPLVPQMCLFFAWGAFDLWRRKTRKD